MNGEMQCVIANENPAISYSCDPIKQARNIIFFGINIMENQESSANTGVESPNTPKDSNKEDTEGQTDNTQSSDIYKVQPRRNKSLKSLALSILKCLPEDILREDPDFSSIKTNDTIQDYEACQECDKPILTEDPPRSLVLNICGDIVHRTCAKKPDKRGVLECSCGVADDKDPLLPSEEEMDVDEENNEDGEVESTLPEESDPASSNSKKRANEATDSSASKKSKKRDLDEDSNILKRLIRELSSDTTRISVIKEKKGLQRESMQEDKSTQIFFDLYFKITNAEERNEKARHELIIAYYDYGEELEKRLAHYREKHEEHEALKKLYDEVKDQLPKEVTKNAIRKKSNRARKVYDLFFRITNDKIQRMVFIQRIKSFSATSISNLSDDNIRYVASQVKKNTRT
jgi:hypothetical protein